MEFSETDKYIQRRFRTKGRNRNLPWYFKRGNRDDLAQVFGKLNFNEGVEIGTNRGRYAHTLCTANTNLHLTCVDPWIEYTIAEGVATQERQDRIYQLARNRLDNLNVTILKMTSMEAINQFEDESIDFVYIDGNHTFDFITPDLIFWSKKVKDGGIVALHDYHPFVGSDVVKAVDAYTHCHGIYPWYVTREELPSAFWVKKKDANIYR